MQTPADLLSVEGKLGKKKFTSVSDRRLTLSHHNQLQCEMAVYCCNMTHLFYCLSLNAEGSVNVQVDVRFRGKETEFA